MCLRPRCMRLSCKATFRPSPIDGGKGERKERGQGELLQGRSTHRRGKRAQIAVRASKRRRAAALELVLVLSVRATYTSPLTRLVIHTSFCILYATHQKGGPHATLEEPLLEHQHRADHLLLSSTSGNGVGSWRQDDLLRVSKQQLCLCTADGGEAGAAGWREASRCALFFKIERVGFFGWFLLATGDAAGVPDSGMRMQEASSHCRHAFQQADLHRRLAVGATTHCARRSAAQRARRFALCCRRCCAAKPWLAHRPPDAPPSSSSSSSPPHLLFAFQAAAAAPGRPPRARRRSSSSSSSTTTSSSSRSGPSRRTWTTWTTASS